MIYLGLDCGGMNKGSHAGTGLTILHSDSGELALLECRQVNWDEWTLAGALQHYVATYDVDKVIYEEFIPRRGVPFETDTMYLNGAIKAVVEPSLRVGYTPSAHKGGVKRDYAKHLVQRANFKVQQGHVVDSTSLCVYHGLREHNPTILENYRQWLGSRQ